MPASTPRLGFVGLGVMGEPMSANLLQRSGLPLTVFDIDPDRTARVVGLGASRAADLAELADASDIVFLSLPAAEHVESVVLGPEGLLEHGRPGQIIVDMSTSPVELARRLSEELAAASITFVDAPVARTRQAAIDGTLAVMVGCADDEVFTQISPLLSCMATDVTRCGLAGAGALMKLLNNMIVFETVVALAEAISVVRRSGLVDETVAFDVLSTGSAGSFALENHGKKALLPDVHPSEAFSSRYMAKDLAYALTYARSLGLELPAATLDAGLLTETIEAGYGDRYHTSVVRIIDPDRS
jgi:3-hydroxyisobutyrate dehydrogenase-like beta-hydroxyacid dehydrogenase